MLRSVASWVPNPISVEMTDEWIGCADQTSLYCLCGANVLMSEQFTCKHSRNSRRGEASIDLERKGLVNGEVSSKNPLVGTNYFSKHGCG